MSATRALAIHAFRIATTSSAKTATGAAYRREARLSLYKTATQCVPI
jgi:hypothetical protein